jgi:hypothetical protein
MKLARALLAFATFAHMVIYLVAAPEHIVDEWWPRHARFHVLQALQWAVGFDLVLLWLIAGPLKRAERWTLGPLVLALIFLHGSYFTSFVLRGGAPPNLSAHVSLGASTLIYVIGLALAARSLPRAGASAPAA